MNRSFWLAVLMVLARHVCQPPVPFVFGNNVKLAVLAVTLAEGWLFCASAVPITRGNARLKAARPLRALPIVVFMFFTFCQENLFLQNEPCPVVLPWFVALTRLIPTAGFFLTHQRQK